MARMLSKYDLEITSGKAQVSFTPTGYYNNMQYLMNNDITLMISSLWICVYNCETKGPAYSEAFANEVLDYVAQTRLLKNFDLDGHFIVPIPQNAVQYWSQGPLVGSGPMWAPHVTALLQRDNPPA